jgi:hypothetical protein
MSKPKSIVIPHIQKWLHTPPEKRIPLSWVKCMDGSWALVPTHQAKEFKEQDEFHYRMMEAASFAFQVVLFGAVLIGLPAFVIILYFTTR